MKASNYLLSAPNNRNLSMPSMTSHIVLTNAMAHACSAAGTSQNVGQTQRLAPGARCKHLLATPSAVTKVPARKFR